ncbi:MAG: ABC transporter substrate-binding protein [Sedimentisphaerales bacterium]|nr:ABC transporter substrate-binding protein [Sedimentisphaerales bacterium]
MKTLAIPIILVGLTVYVFGEPGISDSEILLGQSCALAGPAEALGTGMQAGLRAYFEKVNASGGIKGRKIRLVSLDDGYEPQKAIENTHRLINQDRVFMLIGEVGTPTSKAVVPMAEEARVPFFGPFTGAEFLRNPFNKYVINVRASYYQEMEELAQYLMDQMGFKNIACFYQNDDYGKAGLSGIEIALGKRNMKLCATGAYERNTTAVRSGLMSIRRAKPEAVVMVGAYKPCAEFIKLAGKIGMNDVVFCNISFVGTEALRLELGEAGEGCIISQVVNFPWDQSVPLIKEYTEAIQTYQPDTEIGFVTLEGYMVGKLFCMIAEQVDGELTREKFIQTVSGTKTFDLGGVRLHYGPQDHQGMDQVFLTVIKNGHIQPLGK